MSTLTSVTEISPRGGPNVFSAQIVEDVDNVRKQFPDTRILAHPECSPAVVEAADFSGSTSAMIRHVEQSSAGRYLLLTECSMGDNIVAEKMQLPTGLLWPTPILNQMPADKIPANVKSAKFKLPM